ncbi:MAG: hypothetical protein IIY06_07575 [Proteobacteria bacterium]|nr:hypothetical protein [Pseudomonadota bacterium]
MMKPIEIQNLLAEAVVEENKGEFLNALRKYRDVYASAPHDQDAILGLARVALTMGELEYAFDFFVKLLIENHRHPWGFWGRAVVYFAYQQPERAFREVCRAIEYDSPATSLRVDCAVLLNENGYYQEALDALRHLPEDDFDEDAKIEWCYAEIMLGNVGEKTNAFLHQHVHLAENALMWQLLNGMALYHEDKQNGLSMINAVLLQEPDLRYRVEAMGAIA